MATGVMPDPSPDAEPEAMARKQLRATEEMQITLLRLRDEFGVDASSALQLQGPELGEWLVRAEDTLFLQLLEDSKNEHC